MALTPIVRRLPAAVNTRLREEFLVLCLQRVAGYARKHVRDHRR
jgi:hypothetical protein